MPLLTTSLQADGPLIRVGVCVSTKRRLALESQGLTPPAPVLVQGLIDTGASCSVVDPAIIAQLGLTPTGVASIHTPSTGGVSHQCHQYDVSLAIVLDKGQVHVIHSLPVIESKLHHGLEAILGRDVLERALLFYNGPARTISLAF